MGDASLADVVAAGDLRASLEALRDRLAKEVERVADDGFCPACKRGSSSVAPLAKQLADVIVRLDALPVPKEKSAVDDLAKKRAARRRPAMVDRAKSKQQRGTGSGRTGGKRGAAS